MSQSEGNYTGDWLKYETAPEVGYCRDVVTIDNGLDLVSGTVLGKITSGGKYVKLNPDASDGSQTAAGILLYDVAAASAEVEGVVLARGPAVVVNDKLTWTADTNLDQAASRVLLEALGIQVRDGV